MRGSEKCLLDGESVDEVTVDARSDHHFMASATVEESQTPLQLFLAKVRWIVRTSPKYTGRSFG